MSETPEQRRERILFCVKDMTILECWYRGHGFTSHAEATRRTSDDLLALAGKSASAPSAPATTAQVATASDYKLGVQAP